MQNRITSHNKKDRRRNVFTINTPAFLKEVFDNYPGKGGVLKVPANILRQYLWAVAERCSELNDPVLNGLMCQMALYGISDPYDKENYDPVKLKEVMSHPDFTKWRK